MQAKKLMMNLLVLIASLPLVTLAGEIAISNFSRTRAPEARSTNRNIQSNRRVIETITGVVTNKFENKKDTVSITINNYLITLKIFRTESDSQNESREEANQRLARILSLLNTIKNSRKWTLVGSPIDENILNARGSLRQDTLLLLHADGTTFLIPPLYDEEAFERTEAFISANANRNRTTNQSFDPYEENQGITKGIDRSSQINENRKTPDSLIDHKQQPAAEHSDQVQGR